MSWAPNHASLQTAQSAETNRDSERDCYVACICGPVASGVDHIPKVRSSNPLAITVDAHAFPRPGPTIIGSGAATLSASLCRASAHFDLPFADCGATSLQFQSTVSTARRTNPTYLHPDGASSVNCMILLTASQRSFPFRLFGTQDVLQHHTFRPLPKECRHLHQSRIVLRCCTSLPEVEGAAGDDVHGDQSSIPQMSPFLPASHGVSRSAAPANSW